MTKNNKDLEVGAVWQESEEIIKDTPYTIVRNCKVNGNTIISKFSYVINNKTREFLTPYVKQIYWIPDSKTFMICDDIITINNIDYGIIYSLNLNGEILGDIYDTYFGKHHQTILKTPGYMGNINRQYLEFKDNIKSHILQNSNQKENLKDDFPYIFMAKRDENNSHAKYRIIDCKSLQPLTPYVDNIVYDEKNKVINIVDTVLIDEYQTARIFFSVDLNLNLVGLIYTDCTDSMTFIDFTKVKGWPSYEGFKLLVTKSIKIEKAKRLQKNSANNQKLILELNQKQD